MSDGGGTAPDAPQVGRAPPTTIVLGLLRAAGSTIVLLLIYYLLPITTSRWLAITILVIGLVAFVGLVAFQVRAIIASPFPGVRALEAFATSVPLFLLVFASTYVALGDISGSNFNQHMTHTNALYFAVTVFATVGFGDITATTATSRLVVTVQMILDLIVLGVGVKVILGAVTRGRQRHSPETGTVQSGSQSSHTDVEGTA